MTPFGTAKWERHRTAAQTLRYENYTLWKARRRPKILPFALIWDSGHKQGAQEQTNVPTKGQSWQKWAPPCQGTARAPSVPAPLSL